MDIIITSLDRYGMRAKKKRINKPSRKTDENAVVSGTVASSAFILYVSSLSLSLVLISSQAFRGTLGRRNPIPD